MAHEKYYDKYLNENGERIIPIEPPHEKVQIKYKYLGWICITAQFVPVSDVVILEFTWLHKQPQNLSTSIVDFVQSLVEAFLYNFKIPIHN